MVDTLTPIVNIKGPPGYNATDAAEDIATLADYVRETAGANDFAAALAEKFANSENTLAYAENASNIGTTGPAGSWANPLGLVLHVPPTEQDVWIFWDNVISTSVAGQGYIATAMWDITVTGFSVIQRKIRITRSRTSDPITNWLDNPVSCVNVGKSATDRFFMHCVTTTQEGSSLSGYVRNGNAGYDHSWCAAVTM